MRNNPTSVIESPSGKDADYENFPVGSWLLPAAVRPHIAIFYTFARAIDDIADSPDLDPQTKVERLNGFEQAILGANTENPVYETGHRMRSSLLETGLTLQHCLDLLTAFRQDAVKSRYDDWDDLVAYCQLSAAPVGRLLIDLHGGSDDGYGPSDALCIALQVINHLQDCQDDYLTLDRVYLPGDWMAAALANVTDLAADRAAPGIRIVLDRCLDKTASLLDESRALPGGLRSRRLAMESQAIINIADRLVDCLRRQDPLAGRVKLSRGGYLWCCVQGAAHALLSGQR